MKTLLLACSLVAGSLFAEGHRTDVGLLGRLVAIPSVSKDVPSVNRAVDVLEEWLRSRGVRTVRETMPDGRATLYAATAEGKVQDWLFNAHLDVVPAPPEMFRLVEKDGWLCGRGAGDCKGNVVAIARLLAELNGRASVGAVFSTDEEIGGATAQTMVDRGYGARKLVVVMDSQPYALCIAEKGHTYFTLVARGKAGHSSRPWEGDNAFDRLMDGLNRLRPVWPREATAEDFWHDTLVTTVVSAGTVPNGVPEVATAVLNLRYVKPGDGDRWERLVRETSGLEVVRGENSDPVETDRNAAVIQALRRHLKKVWPERDVPFVRMCGATDARAFVRLGVPLVITSVEKRGDHAVTEGVRRDSLDAVPDALRDFILWDLHG